MIIRDYPPKERVSRKVGAAIAKTGKIGAGIILAGIVAYYGGKFAYKCSSSPLYAKNAVKQTAEFFEYAPDYFKNVQKTEKENERLKKRLKTIGENTVTKITEYGDKLSEKNNRIIELEKENASLRKKPEKLEQKIILKPAAAKPAEQKKILQKTYFDLVYSTGTSFNDLITVTQAVSINARETGDEDLNSKMKKAREKFGAVLQKIPGWTNELTDKYSKGLIDIKINAPKAGKRLILGHWKDRKTFAKQKEILIDDATIEDIVGYYNSP
jgi:hypothetical protein